jgi:integrase
MTFKRGKFYSYRFMYKGELIQKSTRQTNKKVADELEAAKRTALAKGEAGLGEKKKSPPLASFVRARVEPWSEKKKLTTATWFASGIRPLLNYAPLAESPVDDITSELVDSYAASRKSEGRAVGTINRELRVLRRILRLAAEWKVIAHNEVPKVRMAGAETKRERVVGEQEFSNYLACATPTLRDHAIVLRETGARPDECHRLAWSDIDFSGSGGLYVREGKTPAARRRIPMTPNVRAVLASRFEAAGRPETGWVFPADTWTGHMDHSTLKKQHAKTLKESRVRPFLLYSLRHTFATKIAGRVDPWTLCRLMGWSTLAIAMTYVKRGDAEVLSAFTPEILPEDSGTSDKFEYRMVSAAGFEPATHALKGHCSTN